MSCLVKFVEIKFQITQNDLHLEPMGRWDITAQKTKMEKIQDRRDREWGKLKKCHRDKEKRI